MSYSQNKEDETVLSYFNGVVGNLLSIGENNGLFLSNALLLIKHGWGAVNVEPSQEPFLELMERHYGNDKVFNFNFAISDHIGSDIFFDSGTHLNKGDRGLLSTLNVHDKNKWVATTEYKETKTAVETFNSFLEKSSIKTFQFISIDAEGNDLIILRQMNLKELGCKCICIEHNGDQLALEEIRQLCAWYGLTKQLLFNAENIILAL